MPNAQRWDLIRLDLQRWRIHYAQKYRSAKTAHEKLAVIATARIRLEHGLQGLMDCWLGTPWDFNGTATTPGQGKIACGYFVSTILSGADFRVSRTTLAQQASQNIIRTFLPQNKLTIRSNVPYKTFCEEIKRSQPGVYIVGLDTHVGFIIVQDNDFQFIHSSGSKPYCVVNESPAQAGVLERSKYRVFANISNNDDVVRRWLLEEKFITER